MVENHIIISINIKKMNDETEINNNIASYNSACKCNILSLFFRESSKRNKTSY